MSICHFCYEPARSNEDAWPLWLISKFDGVQAIMGADIGAKSQRWPTDTPRARIRCVCKRCNNEWMSQIESATKPTIEQMITSEATPLGPEAQVVLARWAVKTAMVFQAADRLREPFYSRAERAAFKERFELPAHTSVWAATCVENRSVFTLASVLGSEEFNPTVSGFVTSLVFGPLALQVLTIRPPVEIPNTTRITIETSANPWQEILLPLWPSTGEHLSWPTRMALRGEDGVNLLATRFRP